MYFAVISPTAGLERYATMSRLQMVLGQVWLKDQEYRDFYTERKEAGDAIILDNGAYEDGKPLSSHQLSTLIKEVEPNIVILPDFLMQESPKTISASLRFLDTHIDNYPSIEWMFVPQAPAGDFIAILQSVDAVVQDPRVGMYVKWIGLPRCLHTHFGQMRWWVANRLKKAYPHLSLHALGSGGGSLEELKILNDIGVSSMDSSSPVWRGWNGCSMSDEWEDIPVNFSADQPSQQMDEIILNNLKQFMEPNNENRGGDPGPDNGEGEGQIPRSPHNLGGGAPSGG